MQTLIVDRGLHIGDTVGWAKHSYMQVGSNSWTEKGWQQVHKGPVGMVMDYKVRGKEERGRGRRGPYISWLRG